jgi:hypothetical protein
MTINSPHEVVRQSVVDLIQREQRLERTLHGHAAGVGSGELSELLGRFAALARDHRTALEGYLTGTGVVNSTDDTAGPEARAEPGASAMAALAETYRALNEAAFGYEALTTMAFRLFALALREMGPKHLRDYAEAAQAITQLIPAAVAAELRERGFECQCTCPMCTFGACGCVAVSTAQINTAWRETAPPEAAPGLLLQPPRPDSDLARAGVRGGELLIAVDDRPVRNFVEVQTAIREHTPGEEVLLRLQRDGEEPAAVRVSRRGDSLV